MLANFTHKTQKGRGRGRLLEISMFLKHRDEGCKSLLIFHWAFQEAAFDVGEVMWPAVFAMLIWCGEITGGCAQSLYKRKAGNQDIHRILGKKTNKNKLTEQTTRVLCTSTWMGAGACSRRHADTCLCNLWSCDVREFIYTDTRYNLT